MAINAQKPRHWRGLRQGGKVTFPARITLLARAEGVHLSYRIHTTDALQISYWFWLLTRRTLRNRVTARRPRTLGLLSSEDGAETLHNERYVLGAALPDGLRRFTELDNDQQEGVIEPG